MANAMTDYPFIWYPGGTVVTEGKEIPVGWVPTFAVDPLNTVAVQNFWQAGPFVDAEYSRDYYPWVPVQKAVTRWVQIAGKPGYYQLTGLGASLGAKAHG